jgi:hypothetical protein
MGEWPDFYFLATSKALLVCERSDGTFQERALDVALTMERFNFADRVVFLECRDCPWRRLCPWSK